MAYSTMAPQSSHEKLLTIGMATYDDYNGVYFTVQALRLYHAEVMRDVEILVVDNNPGGPAGSALVSLASQVGFRYVPYDAVQGTAAPRNEVFRQATTPWVMCVDCHVLFVPGAIRRFLDYAVANPNSNDLLQGPLLDDSMGLLFPYFRPVWEKWMFGAWGTDDRCLNLDGEPFDIPMQGLGVFACRRDVWPGFNLDFRGFGGEEGYLHYKVRRAGNRTLCLPFLRWLHRFHSPGATNISYPMVLADRLRNYLLGCAELGFDPVHIEGHFRSALGDEQYEAMRSGIETGRTDATP